jgi:DNA-binding HxlR family transcriptional regulator
MPKVSRRSPGEGGYSLPASIVGSPARLRLVAAYDDVVRHSEEFAREMAEEARSDPEAMAGLIRHMSDATQKVFQRWTLPIVYALSIDPRHHLRFSQIRSAVTGISSRSLSLTLAELEANGLLERHVSDDKPPHVSYSLTVRGLTLGHLALPLVLHLNPLLQDQMRAPA